jgi:hypothetical protein
MVKAADRAESGQRIVTGVAISLGELCAIDIRLRNGADREWRTSLEAMPPDGSSWPSLAAALAELKRATGGTAGTLAVALMPPLAEVRRLDLPPVKDEELQRLLARNASRYFVNARGPQMFGASAAGRRVRGAPNAVVAAAAPMRLMAAVRAAAEQAGWNVSSIAPAESAWAGGAVAIWPELARAKRWALVGHEDRTDLLELERGRLIGVRRFRAGTADVDIIAETVGRAAKLGGMGNATGSNAIAAALRDRGVVLLSPSHEWASSIAAGDLAAAHFAGQEAGPLLRSVDAVATERDQTRRSVVRLAAVAASLMMLAAGTELWGVHRQLGLVRAERERIRPQIAATLLGRTTVDATSRQLTALSSVERAAPQWTAIITALSQAITDDAYLTAIRARGDSLIVDGLAEHASRVFDALQQTKLLVDIKSAAPVRRERQEDGTALDHFTISARVAHRDADATTLPVANATSRGIR